MYPFITITASILAQIYKTDSLIKKTTIIKQLFKLS